MTEIKKRDPKKRHFAPSGGVSMTKQSARDECDINLILKRGADTGLISHLNSMRGSMADLSDATDYKTGLDRINAAHDAFRELPAHIRQEFDNDPAQLLAFADEPENIDQLVKLGLAEKPEEPYKAPPEHPAEKPVKKIPKEDPAQSST